MSRTSAREHAFKILFQMIFNQEDPDQSIRLYLEDFENNEISDEDRAFIHHLVDGVLSNQEEIDAAISGALKGWSLYRLSKVDLCIMRISAFEVLFDPEIPETVSINEAVNLAKKYSQDAAPAFINGVLGGIVPDPE